MSLGLNTSTGAAIQTKESHSSAGRKDKGKKSNHIVMSYTTPPSSEDIAALAEEILEYLPHDLKKYLGDFSLEIEDFPDMDVEDEFDLESPYDLLSYFKALQTPALSGASSVGKGDADILLLYRRPILDLWCEGEEDLNDLLRRTIFEELGQHCGYDDDEIDAFLDQDFD